MTALLEVIGLSVHYGGVTALLDVSLSVDRGAVVGLIGPNGAGKTTLIDAVSGFTRASTGRITFGGDDMDGVGPHHRARRGLVRTFQSLELFEDLTVRENLLVGAHAPTRWSTLTDALWPKRHPSPEIDEWLEMLSLGDLAGEHPVALSGGQRHLVALGRALAGRPKLLLLDEPAAGLDTTETRGLAAAIRLIREQDIGVLLVDHDMSLVLDVCDTIDVLDYGRVIAVGTPSEIRNNTAVIDAYLGQAR